METQHSWSGGDRRATDTARTTVAARVLGVSPNTLRSWERRFGVPVARRSPGGHRVYDLGELEALAVGLQETGDIRAAVARTRAMSSTNPARQVLTAALRRFADDAVIDQLERQSVLRGVEATLDELVVPAIEALDEGSAEMEHAGRVVRRWCELVARVQPPMRPDAARVLVLEGAPASAGVATSAVLGLALRRAGLHPVPLTTAAGQDGWARALRVTQAAAVVLSGRDHVRMSAIADRLASLPAAPLLCVTYGTTLGGELKPYRLPFGLTEAANAVAARLDGSDASASDRAAA